MAITDVVDISGGLGYESGYVTPFAVRATETAAVVTVGGVTYVGGFDFYTDFLGFAYVRVGVWKSSDNGASWSLCDFAHQPDYERGTGPGPRIAVSYDQSKIGVIICGSSNRAQFYEFSLAAGATFEKWDTVYDGGTGGPTFSFPQGGNIGVSALVGQSDGSWLWVYHNTISYPSDTRFYFSVYAGADSWSAVHTEIATNPVQTPPSGGSSMAPGINLSLQACADSGLSHVWYENCDYVAQTCDIMHVTVTGFTLGSPSVAYSAALPAPTNGPTNYLVRGHSMGTPIIWNGKVVMPFGKLQTSLPWEWYPVLLSCTSGGTSTPFTEEAISTSHLSYQINLSITSGGSLLVVYKNYSQSGSDQQAYLKATKATTGAIGTPSVLWDIQTWAGTSYYPNSPFIPGVSTPNRWIDSFFAVPSSAYADGLWLVTDLSPKPQFTGSPAFLYAAFGPAANPCCCSNYSMLV